VGSINFRIDDRLLQAAHRATGHGTLVLVGGSWPSSGPPPPPAVRAMQRADNVVFTGHRDTDRLPPYLWALDVGLVPYREEAFNRKSYPIKIPQYLAAGVPVVSTPNGATDELAAHVTIASGAEEFESAVVAALAENGHAAGAARRAAAAARPWTVVAQEILDARVGRAR
jgi:teichuronic acid biosynthesis glycosyltransferase TuaH